MTAPTNHYSIAFGHFLTTHISESSPIELAPPKGGMLEMDKPMTLPSHEYRDKFSGTGRVRRLFTRGSVVVRGLGTEFAGRLRRCAFAQYSRLIFSVLDGLRAGGYCVGTRRARSFQGHGTPRGITRPLRRHAIDCLCRHLRDVAGVAVMNCP